MAYIKVAADLFLRGQFDYRDEEILDRTHLHFYYKRSVLNLAQSAGLVVEKGLMLGFRGARTTLLDAMTFGTLRERLARQYVIAARPGPVSQVEHVTWTVDRQRRDPAGNVERRLPPARHGW